MVKVDVIGAIQSFFAPSYVLPHFNSNLVILIPKKQEADGIGDYRTISLANFVFKIITKILADHLGSIASRIISPNRSAFIKGRSIIGPITLTSERVNLLDRKCAVVILLLIWISVRLLTPLIGIFWSVYYRLLALLLCSLHGFKVFWGSLIFCK